MKYVCDTKPNIFYPTSAINVYVYACYWRSQRNNNKYDLKRERESESESEMGDGRQQSSGYAITVAELNWTELMTTIPILHP